MQAVHRVAKNTGILYARMAITIFISLYSTRLVLEALGIKDFGIFNLVGGAIGMLMFLNNAMTGATQRFMSFAEGEGNTEKQKNIFNVSLTLHLITAVLAVLLLETAGYFLFDGFLKIPIERIDSAKFIFHFLVLSTFFTIISVPYDAVINAHENMLLVAILGIVEAVIKLMIAFYITRTSSDKLIVYGLLMALLSVLLLIIRQIYCHIKYDEVLINIKLYFNKSLFKEMTSFAGWSLLGCSGSMIGFYGQGIVLNIFFGTAVNAAQGIASQVGGQLSSFSSTMLKALNPLIAKSEGAGNRNLMFKAISTGSKVSFFLLMILSIPVIIEMPFIFGLWLKNVPEFTIVFCRLLLIRLLIDQVNINLTSLIAAVGNIRIYQIVMSTLYVLPLIFTIGIFKIGLPPFYLYVISIIFSVFTGYINIHFSKILCVFPVKTFFKNVLIPISLTFIISFSITCIPLLLLAEGFIRMILVVMLSLISSVLVIWLFGLTKIEKEYVNDFINLVINKINKKSIKYF